MSLLQLTPDGIRIENFPYRICPVQHLECRMIGFQDRPTGRKLSDLTSKRKWMIPTSQNLERSQLTKRRAILLPLLVDRFDLKFHCEQRDLSTYTLVIAKRGSKLKESNAELAQRHFQPVGRGQLESIGTPLKYLVPILSRQLGRTVFDKTGLTGLYDYTLQWPPDDRAGPFSKWIEWRWGLPHRNPI